MPPGSSPRWPACSIPSINATRPWRNSGGWQRRGASGAETGGRAVRCRAARCWPTNGGAGREAAGRSSAGPRSGSPAGGHDIAGRVAGAADAEDLQAAAIAALGRLRSPRVPELLLRGWKEFLPALRRQVLDVLLSRDKWLSAVLDAIENKEIAAGRYRRASAAASLGARAADIRRRADETVRRDHQSRSAKSDRRLSSRC